MSTTDENPTVTPQGDPDGLGEAGKRALAAERARADTAERELGKATSRLQAFEQAGITDPAATKAELERLASENGTLSTDLEKTTRENTRLNVGLDKGLPKSLISRLQGDDEDALAADADALLAFIPTDAKPIPKADPSQGPSSTPGSQTPDQQFGEFLNSQLSR